MHKCQKQTIENKIKTKTTKIDRAENRREKFSAKYFSFPLEMQDIEKCLKDDETIKKSAKEFANGSYDFSLSLHILLDSL